MGRLSGRIFLKAVLLAALLGFASGQEQRRASTFLQRVGSAKKDFAHIVPKAGRLQTRYHSMLSSLSALSRAAERVFSAL